VLKEDSFAFLFYIFISMTAFIRLFVVAFSLFLGVVGQALAFEGTVVGVADGDTVTVLDAQKTQHKIRLSGIDAPEKAQDYGERSKQNLSKLVFGKKVTIPDTNKDRYGRTISRVLVNGKDAGLEQIKGGFAWHYKKYQKDQQPSDRVLYAQAQEKSQSSRVGLWALANPVEPEAFRRNEGGTRTAGGQTPSASFNPLTSECPCSSNNLCTGPKGGRYCINSNGNKSYKQQ
jgi:endonuclease YncB( thermonuclease family)